MNIFKKIINLLKKDKTLQLTDGTQYSNNINNLNNNRKSFLERLSFKNKNQSPIKNDIYAYLNSYYDLLENYQIYNSNIDSYSALTRINSGSKYTSNKNYYDENYLLSNLNYNYYNVKTQSAYGQTCFYHVKSSNYNLPGYDKIIRIYLNCKSDNISELTTNILQYNNIPNFYLKFASSAYIQNHPRSEKIVLYSDERYYAQIINNLRALKKYKPNLFEDSKKTCAFLPQVDDFLAVARQPMTNVYYDLYNNPSHIVQSTNSFLAKALEESYVRTVEDIAYNCEPELYQYLHSDANTTPQSSTILKYIQQIPFIEQKYPDYLISSMTSKLQILSGKNNLQIKDLDPIYTTSEPNREFYM